MEGFSSEILASVSSPWPAGPDVSVCVCAASSDTSQRGPVNSSPGRLSRMTDTEVGRRDFSSPQARAPARSDPTGSGWRWGAEGLVASLSRVISDSLMSHTHQVFGVFMTPTCRSLLTPLNLSRQTDLINIMIKALKESLAPR